MVKGVFIIHEPYCFEPYCFDRAERLNNYFPLMTLMRDKYPLHIINEEQISVTNH